MKALISSLLYLIPAIALCQNTQLAGLQFYNSSLRPAIVNSSDAFATEIRSTPTSADHYISGNSTIHQHTYYYVRGNNSLYAVNLYTGASMAKSISNPLNAIAPATCIQYDPVSDSIYALALKNHNLYLVRIDPSSGTATPVSQAPISSDGYTGGDATFDPINRLFYYTHSTTSGNRVLVQVNVQNAQTQLYPLPTGATHPLINIQWSPSQQCLIGLEFKNGGLKLARFTPGTNQYSLISNSTITSDGFEAGVVALDDANNKYFYLRGAGSRRLIEVNTTTGNLIAQQSVDTYDGRNILTNIEFVSTTIPKSKFYVRPHCSNDLVQFNNASIGDSFYWDFGDGNTSTMPNPTHTYATPGTYNIRLVSYQGGATDTTVTTAQINGPTTFSLGNDTAILSFDTITLFGPSGASDLLWSTGETTVNIDIDQPGTYWCQATVGQCTHRDSIEVSLVAALSIDTTSIIRNMDFPGFAYTTLQFANNTEHVETFSYTPLGETTMDHMDHSSEIVMHSDSFSIPAYSSGQLHVVFDLHNEAPHQIQQVQFAHDSIGTFTVSFEAVLNVVSSVEDAATSVLALPNPIGVNTTLQLSEQPLDYQLYSINGRLISEGRSTSITSPSSPGVYLVVTPKTAHKLIVTQQ